MSTGAVYLNFRPLEERFREYGSYGWAECTEGRWHFTPPDFLLSNPLIGDALAIQAEAARDTMRPIIEKRMEAEKQGQRRRVLGSPAEKAEIMHSVLMKRENCKKGKK